MLLATIELCDHDEDRIGRRSYTDLSVSVVEMEHVTFAFSSRWLAFFRGSPW